MPLLMLGQKSLVHQLLNFSRPTGHKLQKLLYLKELATIQHINCYSRLTYVKLLGDNYNFTLGRTCICNWSSSPIQLQIQPKLSLLQIISVPPIFQTCFFTSVISITIIDTRGISGGSVEPRLGNTWENGKNPNNKQTITKPQTNHTHNPPSLKPSPKDPRKDAVTMQNELLKDFLFCVTV